METNASHSIYAHPDGRRETIKNGFSWPAFIFGPLWAWRKGMVLLGLGLLALELSLQLIPLIFGDFTTEAGILADLIVTVGVLTWIGSQGNAWLRRRVLNRGFTLVSASAPTEGRDGQPQ